MALNYTLRLDNRRFTGPAAEAQRSLGGLKAAAAGTSSGFAAMAGKAAAVGASLVSIVGVTKALQSLSNAAAEMETSAVQFEVLAGSASKASRVMGQLKDLAASTPFEFPDIARAGRMLLAFEGSVESIAAETRMLGDIAAGVGAPVAELAELYGKMRVQGTLYAEDINQLTGRGIPVLTKLAEITGKNAAEIKKLASEGRLTFPLIAAAFQDLTGKGGRFFGMMTRMSETWNGLVSTLKDNLRDIGVELGKPINDFLKPYLKEAIELAKKVGAALRQDQGFEYIVLLMKKAGLELFKGIATAMDYFDRAATGVGRAIGSFLYDFGAGGVRAISEMIGSLTDGLKGAAQTFIGELKIGISGALYLFAKELDAMASSPAGKLMGLKGDMQMRAGKDMFIEGVNDKNSGRAQTTGAAARGAAVEGIFKSGLSAGVTSFKAEIAKMMQDLAKGPQTGAMGALYMQKLASAKAELEEFEKGLKLGGDASKAQAEKAIDAKDALDKLQTEVKKASSKKGGFSLGGNSGEDEEEGGRIRTFNKAESLLRRYDRMSEADKKKVGSFRNFINSNVDTSGLTPAQIRKLRTMTPEELEKARKTIGGGAGRGTRAAREAAAAEAQANSPETKLEAIRALLEKIAGGMEAIGAV